MKEIHLSRAATGLAAVALGLLLAAPGRAQSLSIDNGRGGGMGLRVAPSAPASPAPRTVRLEDILPASVPVAMGPAESSSFIRGTVRLGAGAANRVPVSIVALAGETPQQLALLQKALAALEQEVAADTAPVRLRVPAVRGPAGFNRDPVIRSSASDIERAEAMADLKARKSVEAFLRKARAQTVQCGNPDDFLFRGLRAGRYLVCLLADVRDPAAGNAARAKPVLWWADVTLGEAQAATFAFTPANGVPWRELFPR